MITREVGDLVLDVDGFEGGLVALLIEGPNLIPTCTVPDGFCGSNLQLPAPYAVWGISYWAVGYIANKTQWIRTNPLITPGFMGVLGEYTDVFGIYPDKNLSNYLGPTSDFGTVTVASDNGGSLSGIRVTPTAIPEPATFSLLGFVYVARILRREAVVHCYG